MNNTIDIITDLLYDISIWKDMESSADKVWKILSSIKDNRLGMYLHTSMQNIQKYLDEYDLFHAGVEAENTYMTILKEDY